jgi:WD40 repeat protein
MRIAFLLATLAFSVLAFAAAASANDVSPAPSLPPATASPAETPVATSRPIPQTHGIAPREARTMTLAGAGVDSAAISSSGRWLALGQDGTIAVYDTRDLQRAETLAGNDPLKYRTIYNCEPKDSSACSYQPFIGPRVIAISPDGAYVAAGSYWLDGYYDHNGYYAGVTRVWQRTRSLPVRAWKGPASGSIAFSPDSAALVVRSPATEDTPNAVWSFERTSDAVTRWAAEWTVTGRHRDDPSEIDRCALAGFDNSQTIFAGNIPKLLVVSDGASCPATAPLELRLWPIGSRIAGPAFAGPGFSSDSLTPLALSADYTTAVTLHANGCEGGDNCKNMSALAVWDVASHRVRVAGPMAPPVDNDGRLTAFATGGRVAVGLVAVSTDSQPPRSTYHLAIWDVRTGKLAAITDSHPSADNAYLLMSPDGSRAYVASGHRLDVWELTVESQ